MPEFGPPVKAFLRCFEMRPLLTTEKSANNKKYSVRRFAIKSEEFAAKNVQAGPSNYWAQAWRKCRSHLQFVVKMNVVKTMFCKKCMHPHLFGHCGSHISSRTLVGQQSEGGGEVEQIKRGSGRQPLKN